MGCIPAPGALEEEMEEAGELPLWSWGLPSGPAPWPCFPSMSPLVGLIFDKTPTPQSCVNCFPMEEKYCRQLLYFSAFYIIILAS